MSGKLDRVNGCLLLEHSPGDYAFPVWSHRVSFVDSGSDELVVASNHKIIGAVGKSINPLGGGYFSLAQLPEAGRRYLDEQTPTRKGLYNGIAMINVR